MQVESGKWKWCLSVSFSLVSNKFQFLQQKREKLFSPLPFSLMPCDSLNCRHSDAAADVAVAVAVGFAVYRTFLALPLHTLGRAQKISLGARFETMTNMQIYVVAG